MITSCPDRYFVGLGSNSHNGSLSSHDAFISTTWSDIMHNLLIKTNNLCLSFSPIRVDLFSYLTTVNNHKSGYSNPTMLFKITLRTQKLANSQA